MVFVGEEIVVRFKIILVLCVFLSFILYLFFFPVSDAGLEFESGEWIALKRKGVMDDKTYYAAFNISKVDLINKEFTYEWIIPKCVDTPVDDFDERCFILGSSTDSMVGESILSFEGFFSGIAYNGKDWKLLVETKHDIRDYYAVGVKTKVWGSYIDMRGFIIESFFN